MRTSHVVELLQPLVPDLMVYNGTLRGPMCVGLFTAQTPAIVNPGGEGGSYGILSVQVVLKGSEDSNETEAIAYQLHEKVLGLTGSEIRFVMKDSSQNYPILIGRDEENICEFAFRVNIYFNKEMTP